MENKMIGIYVIENNITGKKYIGKSNDIEKRWKEHKYEYKRKNTPLYASIRKNNILKDDLKFKYKTS